MNNEQKRKINSLTLAAIMIAGGMTFAIPGMLPNVSAESIQTENLYVSTKYFGGPMVVEIIVRDQNISDTDEEDGEPDVTFDGNDLVMTQASDGFWYAYVAHTGNVRAFDQASSLDGKGFDFGTECPAGGPPLTNPFDSDAIIFVPLDNCDDLASADSSSNILRSPKEINSNDKIGGDNNTIGQIGLTETEAKIWPFIQTFDDLSDDGTIEVIYNPAGNDQVISIEYDEDMDDRASYEFDRTVYPHGADVHLTITDNILNIDPTDEDVWTFDTDGNQAYYYLFDESGETQTRNVDIDELDYRDQMTATSFGDSGIMIIDANPNSETPIVEFRANSDQSFRKYTTLEDANVVTVQETAPNSGMFSNTDSSHKANLVTTTDKDVRGLDFTFDYADSATNRIVDYNGGQIVMDESSIDGDWNSGEPITVEIRDQDFNKNTRVDDDFSALGGSELPIIQIGQPTTMSRDYYCKGTPLDDMNTTCSISDVNDSFVGTVNIGNATSGFGLVIPDVQINQEDGVHTFLNYDTTSFKHLDRVDGFHGWIDVSHGTSLLDAANGMPIDLEVGTSGLVLLDSPVNGIADLQVTFIMTTLPVIYEDSTYPIILDVFTIGQDSNGNRYNDAIYRLEAEETDVNTGVYSGTVEYIMLNQINLYDKSTFTSLATISDELDIIVHEDLTDEDAVEVFYLEFDSQGIRTPVSAQQSAPTYSGRVSFDQESYKVADTVTITLTDPDLNTDSDLIDIYTAVPGGVNATGDTIALPGIEKSLLLDVTFDDKRWVQCPDGTGGLSSVISSIRETSASSGVFTTSFQIPDTSQCVADGDRIATLDSVTGLDLEVNYQDFRDASGEEIEVGASAGVRAHTGSVSLDRTVYPVPFGEEGDPSSFPLHASAKGDDYLDKGDLNVHIRVNDPDFDTSANGQDKIEQNGAAPVVISVLRGSHSTIVGWAGNTTQPIAEIAPDAGVFEYDLTISYDAGPDANCPRAFEGCILQGDILQVVYEDPTDASGNPNTVTDSATFDLRNGVLQSDKTVYIIGSDMILTLIEPDFDLDNDAAETYDLDLIEWDSDAAVTSMGDSGLDSAAFDPETADLRETGDSTGIFQVVIEIPESIDGDRLERGEEIILEYTDWGPSGADYVGDEDEDVNLTVFTSNFGATVELDQKVYTWTDKVYITIVAPDHNFDSALVDEIGDTDLDPIKVSTRGNDIDNYKLVETGPDTGIFTGEVILTGFASHDADGDGETGDASGQESDDNSGPTDGKLPASDDDGLTVSFEFSDGESVVGSALIRWNIGEVQWLEASYPASGTGVVRIIDPDMNLDPEAVDNFDANVWSDSDAGGIDLAVTETNEATGIFEGTVFFTVADDSSGHRLRVSEGDTVTAEYVDNTLPDPYTTGDELDITATSLIGTVVPPLERVPAANLRAVDAFGNSLDSVSVDQQIQLTADLSNGQDREQPFAYLVQIQDANSVTVSLAWVTGTLSAGQSFSPASSWTPTDSGTYTVTVFVWESVDNPTALSPPVSTPVNVS